ncbi:MAG: Gamma-butyrobetaine dioxygenase [Ilumatobacteraceae bacterium]|nr:Gamma-butyrobetaine dioxygenase [Ilumatobacteraceae bacterium]MCU1388402.1 Gamma-butyrobetaine dioxygenase [Ilumatobacteraceae bacterium]
MGATVVVGDLEISALWLRDSCICNECRHAGSGQRLRSVLELDPSTSATAVAIDGDSVRVMFSPDDHAGVFSLEWLRVNAPGRAPVFDDRSERGRTPWRAADMADGPPTVSWSQLLAAGPTRAIALGRLFDLGLLLVRGVPTQAGQVLDVVRTFGFVRTTNYGDLFDVRVEPQPTNLAFTGRAIGPHTDNPYREPVPGIQLLHCLTSSANGGENVLIDGFSAAAMLRAEDRAAYELLATTRLTFAFEDAGTVLRATGTTLEVNADGDVRGIRWNDRSVQPPQVAADRVDDVYAALRSFAAILARPDLRVHLTLAPGDCIVFDNTRILHARTAFTDGAGARHLQGCYADLDGLASTVAVLERTGAR